MEDHLGEASIKMAVHNAQRKQKKREVCESILSQLQDSGNDAASIPGFADELQAHFNRLPTRYALDVHIDRTEDVLTHKRLLEEAKVVRNVAAFHVRSVEIFPSEPPDNSISQTAPNQAVNDQRLQPPASEFNSPTSALIDKDKDDNSHHSQSSTHLTNVPRHEVTISCIDRPKLLSQLSALLADVGLNIREAHVFSTTDGYSLDVFVVDGWPSEGIEDLKRALRQALSILEPAALTSPKPVPEHVPRQNLPKCELKPEAVPLFSGTDDWEIDSSQLKFIRKVSTGSSGDLYQGSYCGQDVAVKVLYPERMNESMKLEFQQEVFIMRKVRHKNIVQFIGACTKPPNLCIVTEYMSGGSVYDYLHQQKAVLRIPMLLRVAIDVSKAMNYLHQNKIIHRDLKAANLLMDENEVVKVADFGVARVQAQSGIMTAETGTYRWMAPEVIEHKPYDCKADVFSFGIVLWELLTGQHSTLSTWSLVQVPYADLTPLQAAVGVVQKGLRPTVPEKTNPKLSELLHSSWKTDPAERPSFSEITGQLEEILKQVNEDVAGDAATRRKDKKMAGSFSTWKHSPTQ
ncbi:serine/threonine-protein kinase STY46 isoform X3 [Physcomitrium patens]|uniref:non-specific serine/threonine protein kinase n=1 Tax=Physcomitrium patens TaxID=3218 RepID=A0A7I4BPM0_PHYPA|nr:serine/threonine-protein kinase STY46-like isoform X1 [Physcomitrium patens]|eukprot:XP_024393616.1 serine/threonine-protein kinase STY46-like isoform X1 [Physcomitrella patens]